MSGPAKRKPTAQEIERVEMWMLGVDQFTAREAFSYLRETPPGDPFSNDLDVFMYRLIDRTIQRLSKYGQIKQIKHAVWKATGQ